VLPKGIENGENCEMKSHRAGQGCQCMSAAGDQVPKSYRKAAPTEYHAPCYNIALNQYNEDTAIGGICKFESNSVISSWISYFGNPDLQEEAQSKLTGHGYVNRTTFSS